jgi:hypothetical protein
MNHRHELGYAPALALTAALLSVAASSGGCTAVANAVNNADQLAQGCSEFPATISTVSLDSNTDAFVTAGANIVTLAGSMETSVFTSCANIATGLGVMDTWTAMSTLDEQTKEACSQASTAITAALNGAGDGGVSAQGECGLSVSGGECTVSAMA